MRVEFMPDARSGMGANMRDETYMTTFGISWEPRAGARRALITAGSSISPWRLGSRSRSSSSSTLEAVEMERLSGDREVEDGLRRLAFARKAGRRFAGFVIREDLAAVV